MICQCGDYSWDGGRFRQLMASAGDDVDCCSSDVWQLLACLLV